MTGLTSMLKPKLWITRYSGFREWMGDCPPPRGSWAWSLGRVQDMSVAAAVEEYIKLWEQSCLI